MEGKLELSSGDKRALVLILHVGSLVLFQLVTLILGTDNTGTGWATNVRVCVVGGKACRG